MSVNDSCQGCGLTLNADNVWEPGTCKECAGDLIWFSACSLHKVSGPPNCAACKTRHYMTKAEHEADTKLWQNDYREWFRKANGGHEPDDYAWATWEKLTGKKRPEDTAL
jgi:hypothetical protein